MKESGLGKEKRILKDDEFQQIYRKGKRCHTKNFTVIIAPNSQGYARLGLRAGRKVGGAIKRNQVKRLAREFFRLNQHRLVGSQDYLIIAKKEATDLNYHQVFNELSRLFDR